MNWMGWTTRLILSDLQMGGKLNSYIYHAKLILLQAWPKLNKFVSFKSYHNGPKY